MDFPLISIALCTYNGEKYLAEQLDSIVNQTYKNIEVIAVDDCSTDHTLSILQEFATKDSRVKIYSNEVNRGYSKNFEYAISLCNGDYIAVSDQDDIWVPDKLELLSHKIRINDDLLIHSNSLLVDENGKSLNKTSFDKHSRYQGSDPRALALFNIFLGHSLLFKRELIKFAFPIPQHSTYDAWLGFVATNKGRMCVLDKVTTLFRQHNANSSKKWEGNTKLEKITLLKNRIQDFLTIPDLKHRDFFEELYRLVEQRANKSMDIRLLLFLFRYQKIITSVSNSNIFSKLNRLRKFYI